MRQKQFKPKPRSKPDDPVRCDRCGIPFSDEHPQSQSQVGLFENVRGRGWTCYNKYCEDCEFEVMTGRQNNDREEGGLQTTLQLKTDGFAYDTSGRGPRKSKDE